MPNTLKTGWHVLYVKSCQEKKVHQLLQENKLESFLPMIKTIRKWSDRKKVIDRPLFPSYVFVNINTIFELHQALSLDGACSYVKIGKEYALATEKEIAQVKFLLGLENTEEIKVQSNFPKVGDIKKITYGPLAGLECEIINTGNKNKIIARIDSLKQCITASIPLHYFDLMEKCAV